jgi:hypothetical protein
MMWVSSTMDGNKQEGKWLTIERKVVKWAKSNSAPPKDHLDESPWQMGWLWHHFHDYDDYKTKETWIHRMHKQKGWIVWCPHLLHEVLEIWSLFYTELKAFTMSSWKTTQSRWRSKVHLMPWITVSQPSLVATPNWCGEKCVAKASWN